MYLAEEKHGKSLNELYELVQYAGNILPRLYVQSLKVFYINDILQNHNLLGIAYDLYQWFP